MSPPHNRGLFSQRTHRQSSATFFFFYIHTQHTCRTINSRFIVCPPPTSSSVRVPRIPVGPAQYDAFNGSPGGGGESPSTRIRRKHRAKLTVIVFCVDLVVSTGVERVKNESFPTPSPDGFRRRGKQPKHHNKFDDFYRYEYRKINHNGTESSPPLRHMALPPGRYFRIVYVIFLSFTVIGKKLSLGLQLT